MTRYAWILAVAALAGCSSRERSYSDTSSPTAANGQPADQQAAVIRPADLSPEQVRTVQRSLSGRGFAVDASGTFDDKTQTALMDFQRARGLPATGNLNNPTIEALGIDPRDVMPVRGARPAPPQDQGSDDVDRSRDEARRPPGSSPSEPVNPGQPDPGESNPNSTGPGNVRAPSSATPPPTPAPGY